MVDFFFLVKKEALSLETTDREAIIASLTADNGIKEPPTTTLFSPHHHPQEEGGDSAEKPFTRLGENFHP